MRLLALLSLCLVLVGCGSARKPSLRSATGLEEVKLRDALAPLLAASGIWRGPEDGCAVALGIETLRAIDLGVGRLAPMWSHWLNTHPTPGARLVALREICRKTP